MKDGNRFDNIIYAYVVLTLFHLDFRLIQFLTSLWLSIFLDLLLHIEYVRGPWVVSIFLALYFYWVLLSTLLFGFLIFVHID
jgi:hypothetical protein